MVIRIRLGQSSISSLASRNRTYDEIISSLKDDDISLIGVHGMAGVGKTTLVKKVYNYAVKEKLFDVIIWLVVSQDPDVTSRITGQISRALGLHDSSSEFYERIVNSGKRVLIVLDDVWHHLDLQTLGIPMTFGHRGGDPCKFLLSSRNKETLRSMHSSMKLIPVTTLPKEESSLLFNQVISTRMITMLVMRRSRHEYSALIQDMVENCEGLPLVINGVARLLKGASLSFWKYAADQLRKSIFQFGDGMSFFVVKFSYDCLRNEEDKFMFLLCSIILGKKIYCQDLVKYGLGLGLFEGVDAMRAARERVYHATNSMKETYLLQDGETSQYATMDKIYHDLALKIASRKPDWFIVRDGWTIKWPKDENEMAKVTYVSLLISNDTHEYPQGLPFPNLKLLHLHDANGSNSKIADDFFERTNRKGLKVLALIKMQLLSLPSSLCVLSNMDTLCLDYCVLGDISMIGELLSLRVLSLSNTNIEQLPIQIGQLIRLCLLDLSNCFNLKVIQPTVLSSLTKLEELRMRNSFSGWEGVGNASLTELRHLNSLSALDIHIPDAEIIPEALPWDHLQRYNVIIGQDFPSSREHGAFKVLKLNHNKGNLAGSKDWIESLLGSCEQLWLNEFKGLGDDSVHPSFQNLTIAKIEDCPLLKSVFNKGVFQLRELEISGCTEMVAVANIDRDDVKLVDGKPCDFGFPHLHSLTLQNLDKLTGFFTSVAGKRGSESASAEANIYSGSLFLNLAVALPLLKLLKLINIPKIRHLVATTTTDQVVPLQNLETSIEIADCNDLCHLFVIEGSNIDENYGGLLPKLRQLELCNLSNFRSIIGDNHPQRILNFQMLNTLTVCKCNQLKYVLPHYILNNLKQLKKIKVSECEMLEQVIETGDSNDMVLPHLESLELTNLPKLASICSGGCDLTSLQLNECNSLKYVFPLSVARGLSSLQELKIISCARIGQIVTRETGETVTADFTFEFPRLDTIILEKLPKFTRFCQDGCTVKWLTLNKVRVGECPKIEKNSLGQVERPLLKTLEVIRCQPWQKPKDPDNVSYLFKLIDRFSIIPELKIENSEDLRKYMEIMELQDSSFMQLKKLEARQCNTELTKFLSKLLHRSHKLEELTVENCELLEQVFDLGGIDKGENGKLPNLITMRLCDLPNLNCIWNEDPSGIIDLRKLVKIEIFKCGLLKNLVSTGLVENLAKLEELSIDLCPMIEEVVTSKGEEEETEEQQARWFPNLKNVKLVSLPNFINFNSGNYHIRFPNLVSLSIEQCPKMNAFPTGFFSLQAPTYTNGTSSHITDEMKDAPPKLKKLKLVGLKTSDFEIWQGTISSETLCELEEVEVDSLDNLKYIFPSSKLPKLVSLVVKNCISLNNVFQQTEEKDIELPVLSKLELSCLPKLKHVFGNDSVTLPLNLETLHIETCHSLEYLFLPFRCINLKTLKISECKILKQIFIDIKEETTFDRVLPHLKSVVLERLPLLANFFLELYEFGSLETMRIADCPAFNTIRRVPEAYNFFTNTIDSFAKLNELHLINVHDCQYVWKNNGHDHRSPRDANKELLPRLKKAVLIDLPNMELLWKREPQIAVLTNLTSLEIIRCKTIKTLFSISVAENLESLEMLKLFECENMKQVLQPEGGIRSNQVFKNLKCLILKYLPSLTSFCEYEVALEFPQLQTVRVKDIPKMETFVKGPLTAPNLKEVYVTFVKKCWQGDLNKTIRYLHQRQGI